MRGQLTTVALLFVAVCCMTAHACSYIQVPFKGGSLIGRTMERGGSTGKSGYWTAAHTRGEKMGAPLWDPACTGWENTYGFVSMDEESFFPGQLSTDGMNEHGVTISAQTLRQSQYQAPSKAPHSTLCWMHVVPWVLGNFVDAPTAIAALRNVSVVEPFDALVPSGDRIHWGLDDAHGNSFVLEYLEGQLVVHDNDVGIMTNDPDYRWHLRNLNNFVGLSRSWPAQDARTVVDTEVGKVPTAVGHGFNLMGIPGDYSPPSRFARLFFLRQYASEGVPAANAAEAMVEATALLNSVFIPRGAVAHNGIKDPNYEATMYSLIKEPASRMLYFKSYNDMQWKLVNVSALSFDGPSLHGAKVPVDDGTLGIKDVTQDLKQP